MLATALLGLLRLALGSPIHRVLSESVESGALEPAETLANELDRLQSLVFAHERERADAGWPHCAKLMVAAKEAFTKPIKFDVGALGEVDGQTKVVDGESVEVQIAEDKDVENEDAAVARLTENMKKEFTTNWKQTFARVLKIAGVGSGAPVKSAAPQMVLVLGPSSAGKSSTTKALVAQLGLSEEPFYAVDGGDIRLASEQYMAVVTMAKAPPEQGGLGGKCPAGLATRRVGSARLVSGRALEASLDAMALLALGCSQQRRSRLAPFQVRPRGRGAGPKAPMSRPSPPQAEDNCAEGEALHGCVDLFKEGSGKPPGSYFFNANKEVDPPVDGKTKAKDILQARLERKCLATGSL